MISLIEITIVSSCSLFYCIITTETFIKYNSTANGNYRNLMNLEKASIYLLLRQRWCWWWWDWLVVGIHFSLLFAFRLFRLLRLEESINWFCNVFLLTLGGVWTSWQLSFTLNLLFVCQWKENRSWVKIADREAFCRSRCGLKAPFITSSNFTLPFKPVLSKFQEFRTEHEVN